jgi:phosphohistidine phosphatase
VKRLTLMRHGNAKWKNPEVPDFERPLNRRGTGECEAMARRLIELALVPTLILTSPSTRTRQSADIVARELGLSARHVRSEESLYLARADDILKAIRATGPRVPHLMVVGHNPGISKAGTDLGVRYEGEDMETGAICSLTFDVRSWSAVARESLQDQLSEAPPARLLSSLFT